ncbi:Dna2/Cas4 domain-containing protein [bacterium]|nr:Dna2/Cas4 domain-containing protein [bacterium]
MKALARNVGLEHAYCPRLLRMQVEGIFVPSSDTEKGVAVHRRVDKPSTALETADTGEDDLERPKVVRSLALTSESLGLTATLDLAEISGRTAVPVEYRKGRPKHISMGPSASDDCGEMEQTPLSHPEAWPTDRIQVGLQAILLEDAGYTVREAIIYYAGEKLRLRIPVDDALKAEALLTLERAKQCAEGSRPLPLVNDSRCPRCSLQPICLPDEVNYQRAQSPTDELTPRKIWPPRDDGIHVVAQQDGVKIGVRGMELRITDKNGAVAKTVPLANLESLSLLGSVQNHHPGSFVPLPHEHSIAFLSPAGRLVAMIDPLDSVSAEVRRHRFINSTARSMLRAGAGSRVSQIVDQRTLLLLIWFAACRRRRRPGEGGQERGAGGFSGCGARA